MKIQKKIQVEGFLSFFSFAHLFSVLEPAHCTNERVAHMPQHASVASGIQAEPVQDSREKANVILHLSSVPELQQSRQVPETCS